MPDVIVIPDTTNGPDVIVVVQEGPIGPTGPQGTVITSGTDAPSGGNDGDIYLQYSP